MQLFQWQHRAVTAAANRAAFGLWARPGTGKTLAALTIAQQWGAVPVVIAPMAVKAQWAALGVTHVYHYEQVRIARHVADIADTLQRQRCCLILDEAHKIANPSTLTTKAVLRLGKLAATRIVLTGTPTANSPADLWAQIVFLVPDAPIRSYRAFQERYLVGLPRHHPLMMRIKGNPFIPQRTRAGGLILQHEQELTELVMRYGITVHDADITDLPERTCIVRQCVPSPELAAAYAEMKRTHMTEIAGHALTADNAAVLATRLLRLASGLAAADHPVRLPNPKLLALYDDLPQITSAGRVIIWSVWTQERADIGSHLTTLRYRWTDDPALFQRDDTYRVLLGSPKVMGAGLNLQGATYQLWASRTWSLIEREQALARNYRVGQTQKTTVMDYVTQGTIDERVMQALEDKSNLLQLIMETGI